MVKAGGRPSIPPTNCPFPQLLVKAESNEAPVGVTNSPVIPGGPYAHQLGRKEKQKLGWDGEMNPALLLSSLFDSAYLTKWHPFKDT